MQQSAGYEQISFIVVFLFANLVEELPVSENARGESASLDREQEKRARRGPKCLRLLLFINSLAAYFKAVRKSGRSKPCPPRGAWLSKSTQACSSRRLWRA
jgi:hypothetical protein